MRKQSLPRQISQESRPTCSWSRSRLWRTQAVLAAAQQKTSQPGRPLFVGDSTYLDLGSLGGVSACLARSEMGAEGPGGSSLTIFEAIERLSPSAIIMVGIAFGMNPEKQRIGDVLVSRQLMNYASQRVGTGSGVEPELTPRGDRITASIRLLDRLRYAELGWSSAPVRFGLIVSGPSLVDNYDYRRQLQQIEREAIGGEMEGSGLYAAAQRKKIDWVLVKAICDWADGNKGENKDQNQLLAARNAAEFTIHALAQGGFSQSSGTEG